MIVNARVAVTPLESVTSTVNEKVPSWVGVPLMVPVEDRVKPGGSDPDASDQL